MFAAFSSSFWSLALAQGYRLDYWLGATGGPSLDEVTCDAAYLAFQKVDIATLICLHIVDTTQRDWREVLARDAAHREWAQSLLDRLQNVAIVYVLTGEGPPPWRSEQPEGFEDYYGQSAYSVFWWLDLTTGTVTVPRGQPAQLFGLRGLIEKARLESYNANLDDSAYTMDTPIGLPFPNGAPHTSPQKRRWVAASIEPKYRIPFLTYLVIAANAVILGLMYLAGYPEDVWVPARFGAIFPQYILEDGEWFRLFTAMFVHFGMGHLFANLMGLMVFGTRVERYFGRIAFCVIYVLSGLLGSLFSLYLTSGYAAGASGAIYGLIGSIFAYTRITGRSIELMNWYIMFLFIGVGIVMGVLTPNVDNYGHIGGLIGGLVTGAAMVGILKIRGRA